MIQKVMPRISAVKPTRSALKPNNSGLKILAGSSMSGWNTPKFEPTEMVIPGGLDFKEKAYYLLTGKMPKSVLERWVPNSSDYIAGTGDQIVTADISGRYVGNLLDSPHDYLLGQDSNNLINDISHDGESSFDFGNGDDIF